MELRIFVVLVEFMSGFEKKLDFSRNFKGEMLDFGYFVSNRNFEFFSWGVDEIDAGVRAAII